MVTTLLPTSSDTLADHIVVPEAVPESPVELVHFTAATATLSLAVPLTVMEAEEVATIVNAGEPILSDGGVVSALVAGSTTGGFTGGTTTGGSTTGGSTGGGGGVMVGGTAAGVVTAP